MDPKTLNKLKQARSRRKASKRPNTNRTRTRDHKWGLVLKKADGTGGGSSLPAGAADEPPIIPSFPLEGRRLDVHQLAARTRSQNSWLKDYEYDLSQLKSVQRTWQIQLTSFPDIGFAFRIYLLWDYDRLWGVFNLGHTEGAMLIDPGFRLSSADDDPQQLSFTWRGVRVNDPGTSIHDPSIAKGKIWMNPCHQKLVGYFDHIAGNGMAGGDRCHFRGKPVFGPPVVPYSLDDVLTDWDEYGPPGEVADIRQDLPMDELEAELRRRDRKHPRSAVPSFQRGTTTVTCFSSSS
ncbi:hypothetical protein ASPCAL12511 [Aspergillus calidoustus]|uniref:Uncharacterized protein n=1 Tax=Aspergillus calidoustus TaxID=454130 RepID=A0A0U5GHL2_ASPCI|nr:hypothetical protein ASPCAL12511 [Aspergillus calidoustus]